ncbi:MAG: HAD superfamily protein involved in N-acetyl-glucosamine catabolism [Pseudolabrys sp.]|jgi:HAD superfamily hydrolase (TIGR01459 family)|nr:HAD superfamily protein involved in N-acetyl-glucosamine catabolism [Pseudolabrys sp.]
MPADTVPITSHFSALTPDYGVVLSDVWGVVHNGVAATAEACDALARFRTQGGRVVLITNAPRPRESVIAQLDHLRVSREAWDDIVSSGDVTRAVLAERAGQSVFHIGPPRDLPVFHGFDVRFAPLETADYVVCTGLFDDTAETPEDYRSRLETMLTRRLFMVCGNPDVVVERGHELVYCAGAIADLYQSMGGEVLYAGKPYRPIYDLALSRVKGKMPPLNRVLAIGDSLRTDLAGANAVGIDFLFITSGIHAVDFGTRDDPDAAALQAAFTAAERPPRAVMRKLSW